ncbi:hypothetical protein MMC25_003263 [Agyrium rufum]|nr:hypothetical protein [Agyrium rufum]
MAPNEKYVQLFGGILARAPSDEEDVVAAPKAKKTKKRKQSKEEEDDSPPQAGGKRGRPRVEARDQNAIEAYDERVVDSNLQRRRTQIRLAQRAYRERKEHTISALEDRVSDLKRTVNDMNQIFQEYHAKALQSGIAGWNFQLEGELKNTAERICELTETVNAEPDLTQGSQSPENGIDGDDSKDRKSPPKHTTKETHLDETNATLAATLAATDASLVAPSAAYDYYDASQLAIPAEPASQMNDSEVMPNPIFDYAAAFSPAWNQNSYSSYNMPFSDMISTAFMTPSLYKTLPLPRSYAYNDSSFARRLLRRGAEALYGLLTNPDADMSVIRHKLRFTFCFANVDQIKEKLKGVLDADRYALLENFNFPVLHLGGSGLHFPRAADPRYQAPPPGWDRDVNFGPRPWGSAQISGTERMSASEITDLANMEGEWYDANDVESYLRKVKGLRLDGSLNEAEIEVEMDIPSEPAYTRHSPLTQLSAHSDYVLPKPLPQVQHPVTTTTRSDDLYQDESDSLAHYLDGRYGGVQTGATDDPWQPVLPQAWGYTLPPTPQIPTSMQSQNSDNGNVNITYTPGLGTELQRMKTKKKIMIDVNRLLDSKSILLRNPPFDFRTCKIANLYAHTVINSQSICVGRAPGYRKESVDSALSEVIQQAQAEISVF